MGQVAHAKGVGARGAWTITVSWATEFREALRSTEELANFLEVELPTTRYPIFIPKKFAQKIKEAGNQSALWKQFVPSELEEVENGLIDPIGDGVCAEGRGIVHRYHNRVLFFPTAICPIQCRYCFRKNELHSGEELFRPKKEVLASYLKAHPEVEEVIFSGGDPLILSDEVLFAWIDLIGNFSHVKYLRFHTRTPVILPERLNADFLGRLETYQNRFEKIIFVVHSNHPSELGSEIERASELWRKSPFEFLTQSVLLSGVNDDADVLAELFRKFINLGMRPYYLHHPDQARGAMHFYLPQEKGLEILRSLRDRLSGWALPHYVVDSPEAQGKRPVN